MRYSVVSIFVFIFFWVGKNTHAQIPTKCFEIKSILVDACSPGNLEGANEQVLLKIGPTNILLNRLSISWPNNSFNGFCQNAKTALKIDSLNQTIQSCGWLKEPTNGILPAGKDILIITSEDMNVAFNSFTNLSDTLIVIFQCTGNIQGHFGNYGTPSAIRSTVITDTVSKCKDSVAYDISKVPNINGGLGGSSAVKDGGAVSYDFAGKATYYNNGCQAAINIPFVFAGNDTGYCNSINTLNLKGESAYLKTVQWKVVNGLGTFSRTDTSYTTYTVSGADVFPLKFIIKGNLTCNDSIFDTVVISRYNNTVEAGVNVSICRGDSTQLNATGATGYSWLPINTLSCSTCNNPLAKPSSTTQYILTGTYGIGCIAKDSLTVTVNTKDSFSLTKDTTICRGNSVQLAVLGNVSVIFSPTVALSCSTCTAPLATPQISTTYTVTSSGNCPISKTAKVSVDTAVITTVNLSGCGSLTYNNVVYTSSAFLKDTVQNKNGCDSILTNVNIAVSSVNRDTIYRCILNGEKYFTAGKDQTVSGFYTDTIKNTLGACDTARVTSLSVITPVINLIKLDSCFMAIYSGVTILKDTIIRKVRLTTALGCDTLIDSTVITIHKPIVKITSSEALPMVIGDSTQLTISPNNFPTIFWMPNNNINNTSIPNPFVNPTKDTKYTVLVEDNFGCKAKDSILITVKEPAKEFKFVVPSAFSPNGDNKNEFFSPILTGNGELVSLKIYNRWGELVFEQDGNGSGWDGTIKGSKQATEVYVYYVIVKNNNINKNEFKQGTVMLVR